MKQYIGTKIVEAVPAIRKGGKVYEKDGPIPRSMEPEEDGYKVRYQDGYESWSPRDVFEKAYLPLTVNDGLRTSAPSISQEMVDDFIAAAEVKTMGDKCTVVRAILRNGFEIVESSACVSAENYDEKLGADICMEKIKDQVWFLLGFLLQTAVHGVDAPGADGNTGKRNSRCVWDADRDRFGLCAAGIKKCSADCPMMQERTEQKEPGSCMSFGQAIEAMKKGKKVARRGWNGKNQHIELASAISYVNPDGAVVNAEHNAIGNKAIAFCGTSGVQMGWLASQADMLAEDWEIVEVR